MNSTERSGVIRRAEAQVKIPGPAGERSVLALQRGTLDIVLGLPVPPNQQMPHEQDEMYFIIRGRGVLIHEGKRDSFEPGDILFVAAGTAHHYEEFSEDLALWRVFYGPRGGEVPA